ncbi:MAG: hypothetical protein H7Z41_01815 [Cytophagales bacterium]|nr:hypothetical protein [Armatimonadota bacterium]
MKAGLIFEGTHLKNRSLFRPITGIAAGTLSLAALLGAGCGGGGATSLGTNPASLSPQSLDTGRSASAGVTAPAGATQRAGVFVTGAAPKGYAHAWVTLHKIEVVDTAEKAAAIWEDPDGLALDLATLKDATGPRYALITSAAVPAGRAHTRIRLTLGKAALLYAPKAAVAQTLPLSDSLGRDGEGRPTLSFSLKKAHDLGSGKDPIVIAFDPGKMALNGGRVNVVAFDGSSNAKQSLVSANRQEPAQFRGTVGDIAKATSDKSGKSGDTGAETTFTLQGGEGQSVVVQVAAGVPITDEALSAVAAPDSTKPDTKTATATPTLITGRRALVRGTLALDTRRIVATEIVLRADLPVATEGESSDAPAAVPVTAEASIVGVATEVKPDTSAFVMEVRQVYGLVPSQSAVNVSIGKGATLRSLRGGVITAADLYASLKRAGVQVEAAGTFDPITATLIASRVTLGEGPVSAPSAAPGSGAATKVK